MAFGTTRAARMAAMALVGTCAVEVAQVHAAELNFLDMLFGARPAAPQAAPAPEPYPSYRPATRSGRIGVGRHKLRTRYAALPVKIHVTDRQQPLDMSQGAAAALMRDETLRPGDIVILKTGAHVFEGNTGRKHAMSDFEPVQRATSVDRKTRQLLARMTRPAGALAPGEARRMVARSQKTAPAPTEAVVRSAEIRVISPWRVAP
ncbi:MAG: hypothetical protein INR70_19345 [Parafilimonas terrae]|nr:hypothetical protein [Parafilimonas terrae]